MNEKNDILHAFENLVWPVLELNHKFVIDEDFVINSNAFHKLCEFIFMLENREENLKKFLLLIKTNLNELSLQVLIEKLANNALITETQFFYEIFVFFLSKLATNENLNAIDKIINFSTIFAVLKFLKNEELAKKFISEFQKFFKNELCKDLADLITQYGWERLSESFSLKQECLSNSHLEFRCALTQVNYIF